MSLKTPDFKYPRIWNRQLVEDSDRHERKTMQQIISEAIEKELKSLGY